MFRSNSGRFSSPGYPFSYPNNARCRWIIWPRFRAIIRVTFAKFDVDRSSFICRFVMLNYFTSLGDPLSLVCIWWSCFHKNTKQKQHLTNGETNTQDPPPPHTHTHPLLSSSTVPIQLTRMMAKGSYDKRTDRPTDRVEDRQKNRNKEGTNTQTDRQTDRQKQ